MDTVLSKALIFKLFQAEYATSTLETPASVIAFDIFKYRHPLFPTDKVFTVNAYDFQQVEEVFGTGVIVTAALCTHAIAQIMPPQ